MSDLQTSRSAIDTLKVAVWRCVIVRSYVFSGTENDTFTQAVVDQTVAFYRLAGVPDAAIRYVDDRPAGHAFITENQGGHVGRPAAPSSMMATMTRRAIYQNRSMIPSTRPQRRRAAS